MISAGILAAGIGTRMGSNLPKQFLLIQQVPIFIRVLRIFLKNPHIDDVYVAMHKDWMQYAQNMVNDWLPDEKHVYLVEGGETRFDSMYALVQSCASSVENTDKILIHDCARPFVSDDIINDVIKLSDQYDMVTSSVPTIDTILISRDGESSHSMPDRTTIYLDQGPQCFKVKQFLSLTDHITSGERASFIEAGIVYLNRGLSVGIAKGERRNFKITTDYDMRLADFLLGVEESI